MNPSRTARERALGLLVVVLIAIFATLVFEHAHAQAPTQPSVTLTVIRADAAGYVPVLNWTTTGVTGCTAGGGWSGAKAASGTEKLPAITATTEYTLTCLGPAGSAFAEWTPPTQRTDGTPVTIVRHRLFHGTASGVYGASIDVPMPAASFTITGLPPGLRYFAVKAFADDGTESDFSAEVAATVSQARITSRATLTVAPPPKPPTGLRVVPVVAGVSVSPVYRILPDGTRSAVVSGFAPVGAACGGPVVFRYRLENYRRVEPAAVQWWGAPPRGEFAVACADG